MALSVIEILSSDDEDESPNKKAKSALDSFAPRQERVSDRHNVKGREGYEDADDAQSPEKAARAALNSFAPRKDNRPQNNGLFVQKESRERTPPEKDARSALSSFLPRKERQSEIGPTEGGDYRAVSTSGRPSARSQKLEKGRGSLPAPRGSASAGHSPLRRQTPNQHGLPANGQKVAAPRTDYQHIKHPSKKHTVQPEEGSLVSLLQQAQVSSPAPRSAVPTGPSKFQAPDETTRRVDTYYKQDLRNTPGGRRSDGVQVHGTSPASPRGLSEGPPRFRYPNSKPSIQPQAPSSRSPLEIVDLFRDTKPEASTTKYTEAYEADARPAKRPRLSTPVVRNADQPSNGFHKQSSPITTSRPVEGRSNSPLRMQQTFQSTLPSTSISRSLVHTRTSTDETDISARVGQQEPTELDKHAGVEPGIVVQPPSPAAHALTGTSSNFGNQYTPDEDALLAELKEVKNLRWEDMLPYFQGRTKGSLQVRYSSKVSKRHQHRDKILSKLQRSSPLVQDEGSDSATPSDARPRRKRRNNDISAASGMISWAEISRRRQLLDDSAETAPPATSTKRARSAQFHHERAYPNSMSRILRRRELGTSSRRDCAKPVPDELKEQIYDNVGLLRYHKGTSGDVTCLAWSPNGRHFAAGSIAISDKRSMQYNLPGNLIVGDYARSRLRELPEHHVPRPAITAAGNVNGLHAMRESQDERLFMTVANVQFSPDGATLYSAGTDARVRAYDVTGDRDQTTCLYAIEHSAPLDLLSISNTNLLATACHQSADGSIGVYSDQKRLYALSPSRAEQQTNRAIFPSALRWGMSHHHSNLLLAGFSIDSIDEERDIAGETCLWDIAAEKRIPIPVTRNVFDVAWNPRPTSTSTVFAIASTPGTQKVSKGTRTVVQCFAPNQGRASRVLEWESPAFDINDVVYCQHDDNLIAAGATDGKVYVWDQRFAGRCPTPMHVLHHGDTLNVVDRDRPREITDTGVRFLAWGATSSRLYTGSSDGVVKIWNPYMATENAHIKDVATFSSAIMSGAFSPDCRDLLIGEDQGRINALSVGHGEKAVRSMRKFDFIPAPPPEENEDKYSAAHELLHSQKIMLRPMGDLPNRQAVQGPKYAGPYLMPTAEEMERAQLLYNSALNTQSDAHARAGMLDDDTTLQAARQADEQATQAAEAIAKLQSRVEDATRLHPEAEEKQLRLHKAEKQRYKLEASLSNEIECCKLDCNYLPASIDDDGKVADSGRSEGRIPDNLRKLPPQDTALLTPEEMIEAGLTSKCISCSGPAAKPPTGLPLCELCAIARRGLTARCAECSAPIRPQTETNDLNRCESCCFACFRCGEAAVVSEDKRHVCCNACKLTWRAGVLGYELVAPSKKPKTEQRRRRPSGSGGEFGEDEVERYAARWGSKI